MNQKKILILVEDVGRSAPGIVFERLISEMSSRHYVDVVCLKFDPSKPLHQVKAISVLTDDSAALKYFIKPTVKNRISKYALKFFSDDFGARLISVLMWKVLESKHESLSQYNCVLSMVSFRHVSPLILAEKIKKIKPSIRNIAYFVDAIPAPLGWSSDDGEFRGTKKFISKRINALDAIFSSNEKMLNYQIALGKKNAPDCRGVVYNPTSVERQILPPPARDKLNFLYTGGIYGKRTAKHVFHALKIVLKKYPTVFIVFVGSIFSECDFAMLTDSERRHVETYPHTTDLTRFYSDATALLDIDADLDDDVFLSSKVINYLTLNRVIISETGKDSPATNLFSGLKSVLQCSHNPDEIAECMFHAIRIADTVDFCDRNNLIKILSVHAAIDAIETAF